MNRIGKISIGLLACSASGLIGWYAFRPKEEHTDDQIYAKMSHLIGVDENFWKQVGKVLTKATASKNPNLSSDDYYLLYKALETGSPGAQKPAMMALGRCPPKNREECFQKVEAVALNSKDADAQSWAYGLLWTLDPSRHATIRQEAATSTFPEVAEEVKDWPEVFPKKNYK